MKDIDTAFLAIHTRNAEKEARLLTIHLFEIVNNESYQRHKGIRNARLREIERLTNRLQAIRRILEEQEASK